VKVIEDDYDAECRYDRAPVGAMQALAPDRVIYLGTSIMDQIAFGQMLASGDYDRHLRQMRRDPRPGGERARLMARC
jgi:GntR family transcriptional regulator/MocR family aminotransferase